MRRAARAAAFFAVAALAIVAPPAYAAATEDSLPDPARERELVYLLRQDCGSCHGLTLKGGLGPALTADALRSRSVESLVATVVHGRPGTAMPPWRRFMSEREAQWLVDRLLAGDTDASR